jgi:hypothetical protein
VTVLPLEPDPKPQPIYERLESYEGLIQERMKLLTRKVDFDNVRLAEMKAEREGLEGWRTGVFTRLGRVRKLTK